MKKFFAIVLAVVMALSMTAVAFAANDGKITVTNATDGQSYTAYRIFDLESFDKETGTYNYKVNADWEDFANDPAIKDVFVSIDPDTQKVTWCAECDVNEFAKLAKAYVEENNIGGIKTAVAADGEAVISNIALGYYLVDSTVGSLCALDTTDKEVEVEDKNEQPTLEKEVKEDSTETWGSENDAQIGQTVEFQITVTYQEGSTNYVVHDTMDKGLTLNADSFVVTCGDDTLTAGEDYTVSVPGDTVTPDVGDPYRETFKVALSNDLLETLEANDEIVIYYTAVLNEDAVMAPATNDNEAKLVFGENNNLESEPSKTETKTYEFDIVKTNSSDIVLDGAEFVLKYNNTAIALVDEGDGVYRVATANDAETTTTIVAGIATIKGLDADTYALEETKAPTGFNKLDEDVAVVITASNKATVDVEGEVTTYEEGGVQVINNNGTELPSTGGIGTTIFYVVGMILVAGAAILLVSRRRMATVA